MRSVSEVPCPLDPNDLNNYFASCSSLSGNAPDPKIIYPDVSYPETFEFSSVTEEEVARCVYRVKSNAVGNDELPIKFVKLILPHILCCLTHVINHCLTTSTFPSSWKVAIVTPVAKKSGASLISDFRPISILTGLSKVFEMLTAHQISEFISSNKLLSPLQSGFRAGYSCSTAVTKILDDIRDPFDQGHLTLLCLLDFSKAFDSVNHNLLCVKLVKYFRFSLTAVKLIKSYLSERFQKVKVGNNFSTLVQMYSGVPQGSILGPLLFSIFINDIFTTCSHARLHAYADDVQLYLSNRFELIQEVGYKLNDDLNSILAWSTNNLISLNAQKSCVLPIYKDKISVFQIPTLLIGTDQLKVVEK